jgi:hypothetical protein
LYHLQRLLAIGEREKRCPMCGKPCVTNLWRHLQRVHRFFPDLSDDKLVNDSQWFISWGIYSFFFIVDWHWGHWASQ